MSDEARNTEALQLVTAFYRLRDVSVRRKIIAWVEMAARDDGAAAASSSFEPDLRHLDQ